MEEDREVVDDLVERTSAKRDLTAVERVNFRIKSTRAELDCLEEIAKILHSNPEIHRLLTLMRKTNI